MILEENLTTESLDAQRIVLDHVISNGLKPESITIAAKVIVAVKASWLKYQQAKIEKAEKKLLTARNHYQRNKSTENKKVDSLKKVNEQLDESSETFLFEADSNPSLCFILLSWNRAFVFLWSSNST